MSYKISAPRKFKNLVGERPLRLVAPEFPRFGIWNEMYSFSSSFQIVTPLRHQFLFSVKIKLCFNLFILMQLPEFLLQKYIFHQVFTGAAGNKFKFKLSWLVNREKKKERRRHAEDSHASLWQTTLLWHRVPDSLIFYRRSFVVCKADM